MAKTLRIPAEVLWFAVDLPASAPTPQDDDRQKPRPRPNDLLRDARLRVRSPSDPDLRLSRRELADAVNAYQAARRLKPLYLDFGYVGKLERGLVRWPSAALRRALRAVLTVDSDAELGFYSKRRTAEERNLTAPAATDLPAIDAPSTTPAESTRAKKVVREPMVTVTVRIAEGGSIQLNVDLPAADERVAADAAHFGAGAVVYSLDRARRTGRGARA
ncbi:hypothetical protein [Actinoplanes sp. NPDC020271]|uniref:hypothetical protein n=1 Tax=Actinoplanes sp. NPDC020271 TaxID=3363896 RepID=UPI00378BAB28